MMLLFQTLHNVLLFFTIHFASTMLTIIVLLIGVLSSEKLVDALERLPNVRYLGMGYDLINGNPENNVRDPGFSFGVLKFTWSAGTTTPDGKYLVPDHVQTNLNESCGIKGEVSKEYGSSSYQEAISVGVAVEEVGKIGIWSARFSASTAYKEITESTTQYHRFYSSARAECILYELKSNYLNAPIGVTSDFERAVSDLTLSNNDIVYTNFINTYGTHFASEVTMGAKMVIRSEFDEPALTIMEDNDLNIETCTKLSFRHSFHGDLVNETQDEKEQREAFERNRRSYKESFLGRRPPSNRTWETWTHSIRDSPIPIRYKLVPLTALLTTKFFPSLSDVSIKRDQLDAACSRYCSDINGCQGPKEEQKPEVSMHKVVKAFKGTSKTRCPPNFNLLSCGILNRKQDGDSDKQRYAVPHSKVKNACSCYDKFGAKCVSWCTTDAVNYTKAENDTVPEKGNPYPNVSCPEGYKVW